LVRRSRSLAAPGTRQHAALEAVAEDRPRPGGESQTGRIPCRRRYHEAAHARRLTTGLDTERVPRAEVQGDIPVAAGQQMAVAHDGTTAGAGGTGKALSPGGAGAVTVDFPSPALVDRACIAANAIVAVCVG